MGKKYYKHKIENRLVIKQIVTIHYFEFDKDFRGPTESHDFWELVYAEKGAVLCTADGREITLAEGEILFHKPFEIHSLCANGTTAPNVFIITFVSASEALHFFKGRRLQLPKSYLRYIYAIIDEAKQTFNMPFSDAALRKLPLLPNPALGGQQVIKNYLEILFAKRLPFLVIINRKPMIFCSTDVSDIFVAKCPGVIRIAL
jgi:quercetin dioxygenase-like cupin family protein